jgi:hypothetical protein
MGNEQLEQKEKIQSNHCPRDFGDLWRLKEG